MEIRSEWGDEKKKKKTNTIITKTSLSGKAYFSPSSTPTLTFTTMKQMFPFYRRSFYL